VFQDRVFAVGLAISLLAAGVALAAGPSFQPAIWADGQLWSTKGVTVLPAPNDYNRQSFDNLYVVTNSNAPEGQLPISEAAPRNPDFNGGRWFTHTVEWTEEGFAAAGGYVPVLKSYDDIELNEELGYLVITPGSFPGGPPVYFECPLLPVKGSR
jgi:hypothetical protein